MKSRLLTMLLLCAVMLFGGCREGGYETLGDRSSDIRIEEFNIGDRPDKNDVYSYSLSSAVTSSSSKQSTVSANSSSGYPESIGSDVPSSDPVIVVIQSVESSLSEPSDVSSSLPKSSSAPIVVVIPEEPPKSSLSVSVVSNHSEPVEDDPHANIGDVQPDESDDTPAGISDVTSEPEKSSSAESSESLSETSVSPYDYDGDVYIAASGNGKKYHKDPKCSNMNGSVAMTVNEALEMGYTPCKKCW